MCKMTPIMRRGFWICAICFCLVLPQAFADFIDLEVESIQIQPPRARTEDSLTVVAVIRNNGSQSAESFDISLSVRQKGHLVRSILKIPVLSTLPRMGSGKSVPVEIGKLAEGDYEVLITADPEKKLKESNETNNTQSENFHVFA